MSRRRGRLSRRAVLAGSLALLAGCNARSDDGDSLHATEVTPATVPRSGRERLFDVYTADLPAYDPPTLVSDDHLRSRFERLETLVDTVDTLLSNTGSDSTDTTTTAERTHEGTTRDGSTRDGTTRDGTTRDGTTTDSGGQRGGRNPPRADVRTDARRLVRDGNTLLERADGPPERWEFPSERAVSGRLLAIRAANEYLRALTKRWWLLRQAADRAAPGELPEPATLEARVASVERSLAYRCAGTGVALPFHERTEDALDEASVLLRVWRNTLEDGTDGDESGDGDSGEEGPNLGEQAFYAVGADLALADANAYRETFDRRVGPSWPCGRRIEATYDAIRPRLVSKVERFESLLANARESERGESDGDQNDGGPNDEGSSEGRRPAETTAFGHARAELLRQTPANTGQLARTDELLATGQRATALARLATLLLRSRGVELAIDALPTESIETEPLRHRAADAREAAAARIETTADRTDRENLFARELLGEAVEAVGRGDDAVAYTVEQRTVTDDGRTELAEAVAQYYLAAGIADNAAAVARLAQPTPD